MAYIFRNWDPKRYLWERRPDEAEDMEDDDPIIGDQWKAVQYETDTQNASQTD